jgi:CII-binding regulator of phage lambda lysogenization HflD
MGVCCNSTIQNITDPEIEESNSIKELTDIMNSKSFKLKKEIEILNNYLDNPNYQDSNEFNYNTFTEKDLKKKLNHLNNLKVSFEQISYQLIVLDMKDDDKDGLKELKDILQNIVSKYYLPDDPKNELDTALDELRQYSLKKIG